ncbi:MAG: hypothetical protein ACK5P7_02140 [Bdellovibrio sp.]|jgi:hypothetical protein
MVWRPVVFVFFAALLISGSTAIAREVPAQAQPKKWMVQTKSDGGLYVVEQFRRGADGWQDRTERRAFSDTSSVLDYFEQNTDSFLVTADPEFQDLVDLKPLNSKPVIEQVSTEKSEGGDADDGSAATFFGSGKELGVEARRTQNLWDAQYKWDLSWEQKFSDWISTDVDAHFFQNYKVSTDCADVLYALRWIFARTHKLEMASRLSGSGDYITHRSVRGSWSALPTGPVWNQDRRFLAALNYILDNTYTHSLMVDSYPLQITSDAIQAGVYHLDLQRESGHTQIVYRTDRQPGILLPFLIFQSTVPRKVREMSVQGFWYSAQPQENKGGLLRLRWPLFSGSSVTMTKPAEMPYFSKEQYAPDFLRKKNFPYNQEVYLRLNPSLDFKKVAEEAYQSMQTMFRDRIKIVDDGSQYCVKNGCPPGSAAYENWSTPSRDVRISTLNDQVQMILQSLPVGVFDKSPLLNDDFIEIQGQTYSLGLLLATWKASTYSSDPNDKPEKRWGVSASSVADWLGEMLTKTGVAREQALKSGVVPAEQDQKMVQGRDLAAVYALKAPAVQASQLQAQLVSRKIKINGEALSVIAWMNRVPWFISDPKETSARQWGAHGAHEVWAAVPPASGTSFTQGGWLLSQRSGSWTLEQQAKGGARAVAQGSGASFVELVASENALVEIKGDQLWFTDLETNDVVYEQLDFTPDRFKLLSRGFALLNEKSGQYALAFVSETGLTWLEKGQTSWWPVESAAGEIRMKSEDVFMYGLTQGADPTKPPMARVWDYSSEIPKSFDLAATSKNLAKLNTDKWISVSGLGFLIKATGTLLANPEVSRLYACHPTGDSCLLVNVTPLGIQYEFAGVEADGSLKVQQVFKGYLRVTEDSLVVQSPASEPKAYRWQNRNLLEIPLLADEKSIWLVDGDALLTIKKEGEARLRKKNQVIFEGVGYIGLIGDDYFEYLDESTGMNSLRRFSNPQAVLSLVKSESLGMIRLNVPVGALSSMGLWLK